MNSTRIVFVTREPIIHQLGGSTTYALNLLEILMERGAEITMVSTNAYSRSPLLWFRPLSSLPSGVKLLAPGFFFLFGVYWNLFSPLAWARAITRAGVRFQFVRPLASLVERIFAERLFTNAWDLTPPTQAEGTLALREIEQHHATTVIANYAIWGPVLQEPALRDCKRVILMHDFLSARVRRFIESGIPLDSPNIKEEDEIQWLNSATCVLAAQQSEAEIIQLKVSARVLVQPLVYRSRHLPNKQQPGRCLFVGSNIIPNQTGLRWFIDEVWPLVLLANPNATLAVVGSICSWLEDGIPGVIKRNIVPAVEGEYSRASVCVVPLLVGSGIKIKLVEALSFGKATVSTSIGIQGLEQWAHGAITVRDDAQDFAASIVHLLGDAGARAACEEAGQRLLREHYSGESLLSAEFFDCVL